MSYDALAVANYLVTHADPPLTNMALQKILYFAEGRYLAEHGEPLFENSIEAWEYGPVVPDVYHAFKNFGSKPITEPAATLVTDGRTRTWRWVTPELPATPEAEADRAFLDKILEDYGRRTAVNLMAESHRAGGPWARAYRPDARSVEIPVETMREYFATHA